MLVLDSSGLKKGRKLRAQDQHRSFVIQDRQASLSPLANGIFVNAKQNGNLFDCVVAVNFHLAVVWVAFCHDFSPRRLLDRLASSLQLHNQLSDFAIGFACDAGCVQGTYFIRGPAYSATTQADRLSKDPLCDAKVDCAPGQSSAGQNGLQS
jgi:hypothetical protein